MAHDLSEVVEEAARGIPMFEALTPPAKEAVRSTFRGAFEAAGVSEMQDVVEAARKAVVAIRMHNAMCRQIGILRAHGPGTWHEELDLAAALAGYDGARS